MSQFFNSNSGRIILISTASIMFGVIFFSFFAVFLTQINIDHGNKDLVTINQCLASLPGEKTDFSIPERLNRANYCFNLIGSQITLQESIIRRDNFVFQRNETLMLLLMVVLITISGVILAGLQLLSSYQLAKIGKEGSESMTGITISATSASVSSSVIGLVILIVSFAFFIVFVQDVYTLRDADQPPRTGASSPAARNSSLLNLLPAPLNQPKPSLVNNKIETKTP